jgi:uncharacterized membrane protein YeaQ/YmgE (transglycosylase-associated protein family)
MGIISWIILGGLAGWIASLIVGNDERQGLIGNIIVGIVGGLLGGFILNLFGIDGINGFNFYSLIVALLGAILLLWIWNMVAGKGKAA